MNKLEGFFALQKIDIPSVQWRLYTPDMVLDPSILWTIRCAVMRGNDWNLPRLIGATACQAKKFAKETYRMLGDGAIIIYYPFFIADKSGTMEIHNKNVVIEAITGDLWKLVTENNKDITIMKDDTNRQVIGNQDFFTLAEEKELFSYIPKIKAACKNDIVSGKSVLLEWSFSYKSDLKKQPVGKRQLLFYEIRSL